MKFPYGETNFKKIRTQGYFYVDKTRYIEILENLPESHLIILRSRRFGKTLFVNMLERYYDQREADQFETLFKGTYIYDHPTPKRNAYMLLTFNFSGINTQSLENANEGFAAEVQRKVRLFLGLYEQHFTRYETDSILSGEKPNDILNNLFATLLQKGLEQCVYVIIDEYDHFANNILSQGKEMFKDLVRTDRYVRPFYEALKKGTEHVVDRMFITGVLPILLDSLTSGFNIGKNKSTDVQFNEMFGFTEEEITPILDYLGSEEHRDRIRTYYNGYRFSKQAEKTVYSDMIESLYLDYMAYMLMKRGEVQVGSREKGDMLQDLVDGKIDGLISLTENLLQGLSNRDYQQFDEKYIKVVMLSFLSNVNIYIPLYSPQ